MGHCDVFPGNLAAVLLELEGGGDLLVDGPGKGVDVLLELKRGGDLLVDSPCKFYLSLRLLHSASQLVVVLEVEEVEDFEETASSSWRCRASLSFLPCASCCRRRLEDCRSCF